MDLPLTSRYRRDRFHSDLGIKPAPPIHRPYIRWNSP